MKKFVPYMLLLGLLLGCSPTNKDDSVPADPSSSIVEPNSSSSENIQPSSNEPEVSSSTPIASSPVEVKTKTIEEILAIGQSLEEGEEGEIVTFKGIYLKALTHNSDKLMLFADENHYLYVRVSGGFDNFLKNRYLNCYYQVQGTVSKNNGNIEVIYQKLSNVTSNPETFDYKKIATNMVSLSDLYLEIEKTKLDKKYSAIGKVVTIEGKVVATNRSDANTKAFIYDGTKTIPVINTSKICDATAIGDLYRFTGCISILKSSPAIMMLDSELIEDNEESSLEYTNAIEMKPSEFSKWYYVGDNIRPPHVNDYGTLYKVRGYVSDDSGRTSEYNFGLVDSADGDLNDNGIKTSIKGVYFLNHLHMDERDASYSVFKNHYVNQQEITLYVILYQFDTSNHGWKVVPLESTIELVTF